MSPANTLQNETDCGWRYAISSGKGYAANGSSNSANCQYLWRREFGPMVTFPPNPRLALRVVQPLGYGMGHILAWSNLLQIAQAVVSLDTVDMVGLFAGCKRACESFQDKAVDKEIAGCCPPATGIKADEVIPASGIARTMDSVASDRMLEETDYSPCSPKVGDLVDAFIANDGAPFFGGCGRLGLHRKTPFGATPGAVNAALRLFYPPHYSTTGGRE